MKREKDPFSRSKFVLAEFEPDAAFDRALPSTVATYQDHLVQVHARERCHGRGVDVHKTGNTHTLQITAYVKRGNLYLQLA